MNKKGLNFSTFGLALLFLTVIAIGFGTFFGGLYQLYPSDHLNQSKSETYQQLAEVANLTNQITGTVGESNPSSDDFEVKVYKQGFGSVKLLFFTGPSLIMTMLNEFSQELGLPTWVVGFIIAVITLLLVLLLISIFIKTYIRL